MYSIPTIPTEKTAEAAYECLIKNGVCLMPGVVDLAEISTDIAWPIKGHTSNNVNLSAVNGISLVEDFKQIAPEYAHLNIEANVLDMPDANSDSRFRIKIHQDHNGLLEGFVLLIPLVHGADLSVYLFDSVVEPPLYSSRYGPRDAVIVAQKMPNERGDSSAVWHGSVSQRCISGSRQRKFLSIDLLSKKGHDDLRLDLDNRRLARLVAQSREIPQQMTPIQ